jgi:acyl dehydratase
MEPSVAGKSYPDATFTVDRALVDAFGAVFDDASDGVPVTFVTAAEFSVIPTIVGDPELGLDFTRVLHGSQEYEFRRPLRIGETVTVRTRIDSIRVLRGNGFLTIVTELVGGDGELACTARSTMIERGTA